MSTNPIKYTSRTFQTILADINADPDLADKPEWFKRLVAGVGDVVSMINNAAANNAYLRTAFTRQAVLDLCAQIGYEVPPAVTSSGTILFYLSPTVTFPVTLAPADLAAATRGTVAVASRRFESRSSAVFDAESSVVNLTTDPISSSTIKVARDFLTGEKVRASCSGTMPTGITALTDYYAIRVDATHIKLASTAANAYAGISLTISGGTGNLTLALYSGRVSCHQQESKGQQTIGQSDGLTGWQEFGLPDADVIRDTLSVTVNGVPYTRVDTLALSKPYDTHYQQIYKSDGTSVVRFGDGEYGIIPPNFDIIAEYATGGGSAANVTTLNAVSVYAGASSDVTGCSNATSMTGGADAQSSEIAKRVAPGTLKSRDRFITAEDGESLAVQYGGLSQAKVIANAYGVLSTKVVGVAVGGGNPSPSLKIALQAYLVSKTIMESIDVRVMDATITARAVTCSAKVLPGYTWAGVQPLLRLAWKLFFAETGQEVIDEYLSNGIASATAKVNSLYSEAFTSSDYAKVQKLIVALDSYGARTFGEAVYDSDAIAFVQGNVDGIDYLTLSAPTFPLIHALDEISTYGAITLTEAT